MQVLAGGDLTYRVVSNGRDELAELGRSIEEMRLAVLEQMKRENEAILANSRLITSLSHDLRTPLTKLMGYLEILRHGKCRDEAQRAEYLRRAADKALQMRALSDEMFRHFQVGDSSELTEEKETVSGPVFLGQLLAEQCFDLTDAGFSVEPPVLEGDYHLSVRTEDICRVFDNLFTNLKKYADPAAPIQVSVREEGERVVVALRNRAGRKTGRTAGDRPAHGPESAGTKWGAHGDIPEGRGLLHRRLAAQGGGRNGRTHHRAGLREARPTR